MDDRQVAVTGGFLLLVFVFMLVIRLVLRRNQRHESETITLLRSLGAIAQTHRDICRSLIADGKHDACGLCYASTEVREWVSVHKAGWMHMVAIADHPSWLDTEVHIANIVSYQFMNGTGKELS